MKKKNKWIIIVVLLVAFIYNAANYFWCNSLNKEIEKGNTERAIEMIDGNHIFSLNRCASTFFLVPYSAEWIPESPLMIACQKENSNVVEKLIEKGANVNRGAFFTDYNPADYAIENCDEKNYKEFQKILYLLVDNGLKLNQRNSEGENIALHLARISPWEYTDTDDEDFVFKADMYNADFANQIVNMIDYISEDINYFDYVNSQNEETILHIASYMGNIALVDYAINTLKIDVNAIDSNGMTALFMVMEDPNAFKIADNLLEAGADLSIKEAEDGMTAEEYLRSSDEKKLADYISDWENR